MNWIEISKDILHKNVEIEPTLPNVPKIFLHEKEALEQSPILWIKQGLENIAKEGKESKEVKNFKKDQKMNKVYIPYFLK